jgi:hypothetical protein
MTNHEALTSSAACSPDAQAAREREFERLCESVRLENKVALFDAFADADIGTVIVEFDGYGDSGQIQDVTAYVARDVVLKLPSRTIEIAHVQSGSLDIVRETLSVRDAIEHLAYDVLEETHGCWEDNLGAYGDFVFDVAARTITLNYNERFEDSEYTQHVF